MQTRFIASIIMMAALIAAPVPTAQAVDPDGLILHLPFDGGPEDVSGEGNHGSTVGAPDFGVHGRACRPASAVELSGHGDGFVVAEATNLDGLGAFTASLWIRPRLTLDGTSPRQELFYKGLNQRYNTAWLIDFGDARGKLKATVHPASNWFDAVVAQQEIQLSGGQWAHVAMRYDGQSRLELFLDGAVLAQDVSDEPIGPTWDSNNALYVGHRVDGQFFFDGRMDDIRVYERALTNAEILELAADVNHGCASGDDACVLGLQPTALAGDDLTVPEESLVTLEGGIDEPYCESVVCSWEEITGAPVTLVPVGPCAVQFATPTVPLGGQTLTLALMVSDGTGLGDTDYANVTVINVLKPPVAVAAASVTVLERSHVRGDMSDSYGLDGEDLTFLTVQTGGPVVLLNDERTPFPYFEAPSVGADGATLTFELTVSNGVHDSTDEWTVMVEPVNHAPVAHAGMDATRDENVTHVLNGLASIDWDGDPLSYSWSVYSDGGMMVELSDPTVATPSFTTPVVGVGGLDVVLELTVSDGDLTSESDYVTVHVRNSDDPPSCHLAQASIGVLWPPSHGMTEVRILGVQDPENGSVALRVTSVTQDEPTNGVGDGDSSPDARFLGEELLVRAERSGVGNGRVYVVSFQAEDGLGQVCDGSVVVSVPHHPRAESIDDGQDYSSGPGQAQ